MKYYAMSGVNSYINLQYSHSVIYLLLVVGDDATDKVRVGVPERGHEVTQLLFIQLAYSTEHTLASFKGSMHRV